MKKRASYPIKVDAGLSRDVKFYLEAWVNKPFERKVIKDIGDKT